MNDLLTLAKHALERAYAPYSRFPVAAAIRSASGAVYLGVNVENSAYPLSRCAEQIAVGALVTAGEREIAEVVIYSTSSPPATPCGACRQILAEFGRPNTRVRCVNPAGETREFTLAELLPHAFHLPVD